MRSLIIYLLFVCLFGCVPNHLNSQNTSPPKFYQPTGFGLDLNGDGKWEIPEGLKGKWVDEFRLMAWLDLPKHLKLVGVDEMRFDKGIRSNRLTRLYLNYANVIRPKQSKKLIPSSIFLDMSAGLLEWYPKLNDPRLVAENIDKYFSPESFYGSSLYARMQFGTKERFSACVGAHTGDLFGGSTKPALYDAYLIYKQPFIKNFGLQTQVGRFQGSIHLVNYAYLYYSPSVEKMNFEFRAGKLPGIDRAPYGLHIGLKRAFNYLELGGYYQKRLNYTENRQIFGFTWRFLKPKALVDVMNTYNFMYDTNAKTLRFLLPVVRLNVNL
jgi:hypothetical protein